MTIRAQLSNVLSVIAELTHNDVNQDVPDTWVTDGINIIEEETRRHINELVLLGLVRQLPRFNQTADERGREYQLIGITREGLQELTLDQELR